MTSSSTQFFLFFFLTEKGGAMFIYVNHQKVFVCLLIILLAREVQIGSRLELM